MARSHYNGWVAYFDGQGLSLNSDVEDWEFRLDLDRYGFEAQQIHVDQARDVCAQDQRLSYEWNPGISEWWINDSRGLEHGFTVHERPQHVGNQDTGPLLIEMTIGGDLRPIPMAGHQADRSGVKLVDAQGLSRLTYDGLVAFDAHGTTLDAWLEITQAGMRIAVLEEGAAYPLTIDPLMQAAYLKASNTEAGDSFGFQVGVSQLAVV